jgi:hypothetical protein
MHPFVWRDLPSLGQLDHMYRWSVAPLAARPTFQRRFQLPDRRIAKLKPLIRKTQPYSIRIAHRGIGVEPSLLAKIEYRAKSAELQAPPRAAVGNGRQPVRTALTMRRPIPHSRRSRQTPGLFLSLGHFFGGRSAALGRRQYHGGAPVGPRI